MTKTGVDQIAAPVNSTNMRIRGDGKLNRAGEVLQELRWAKQEDGWKIVNERDLGVIRRPRPQS